MAILWAMGCLQIVSLLAGVNKSQSSVILVNLKCPTAVPVLTSHVQCARPCPLCHLFSMCRVLSSTSCSDSVSVVLTRHFPILSLYFLAAANPLPECETSSECGIPINT